MTVYVVIREDQNEHGFVDTSVVGVFREETAASRFKASERLRATEMGLNVEGDESGADDWQVDWRIEAHAVD